MNISFVFDRHCIHADDSARLKYHWHCEKGKLLCCQHGNQVKTRSVENNGLQSSLETAAWYDHTVVDGNRLSTHIHITSDIEVRCICLLSQVPKVDIRATGSSEGVLIEYEFTPQELNDCERVIEQLANHSRSNGRVGMFGLSWSGFNSLMMATLRRPPALRAIFAAHGSDDLYKNDIH